MSDFARMTVHELAPLIERREVSPVEVTREALDRIDGLDERDLGHCRLTFPPGRAPPGAALRGPSAMPGR